MAKPRQGGLGRGLGALIPTESTTSPAVPPPEDTPAPETPPQEGPQAGPLRDIAIAAIVPNTYQPRRTFDPDALDALAASIGELGVLQPILVRSIDDGTYELIAGERRWRAAQQAGLVEIPAIVRDVDDETSLAHAIVENVQRAELNAIEEAAAFSQLIDEFSLTQGDVATRVGRSRPAVANALRLLQLPLPIQKHIIDGRLSAGHGRVLVTLESDEQARLANLAIADALSVRALERLARGDDTPSTVDGDAPAPGASGGATPESGTVGQTKPPALLELEQLLGERFDTKVGISLGAKRGRMIIDFADIDDLERIYSLMLTDTSEV